MTQSSFLIFLFANVAVFFGLINSSSLSPQTKVLTCIVLLLEGLSILILASWTPFYFGFIFILLALFFISRIEGIATFNSNTSNEITSSLLKYFTNNGKYIGYFNKIGLIIVVFTILVSPAFFNQRIGQADIFFLILGLIWFFYDKINPVYSHLRDFAFIFLNSTFLFLYLPDIVTNYFFIVSESDFTSWEYLFVEPFLVKPLNNSLSLLGINSFSSGINIRFTDVNGINNEVTIQQACSGIHSVIIFFTAFLAFIDNEYVQIEKRLIPFIVVLGLLMAYFSNLIRMLTIIIIGYYWGMDSLVWAHTNIGWIFFVVWISIFWNFLLRFLEFGNDSDSVH